MRIEPFSFDNRHGLNLVGEVWIPDNAIGLAFIQHGFTGGYDRPSQQVQAKTLYDNGYTVVLFDSTNSWNKSGGKVEDARATLHMQDLEDVISWAATQPFYHEPFILVGASLGGLSILQFTILNRKRVKAVIPISSIVSGKLHEDAQKRYEPEKFEKWREDGFITRHHGTQPEITAQLPYHFMTDVLQYDILAEAQRIDCPVLIIIGERDIRTPVENQENLRDALGGPTEFVLIPEAEHVFRSPEELQALEDAMDRWL